MLSFRGLKGNEGMTDTQKRRMGVRKALLKREMKKKRMALRETQKNAHVGEGGGMVATTMARLRPGYTYQFRVRAVNRVGSGEWSRPTYSTPTSSIEPDAPAPVRVHGNQQRKVTVSWKAPADNGAQISRYLLRYTEAPPKEELEDKFSKEEGGASSNMNSEGTEKENSDSDESVAPSSIPELSLEEMLEGLQWTYKASPTPTLEDRHRFLGAGDILLVSASSRK